MSSKMPNKRIQPTQKPLGVFRSADFKRYSTHYEKSLNNL
jgi:hypothetical protein